MFLDKYFWILWRQTSVSSSSLDLFLSDSIGTPHFSSLHPSAVAVKTLKAEVSLYWQINWLLTGWSFPKCLLILIPEESLGHVSGTLNELYQLECLRRVIGVINWSLCWAWMICKEATGTLSHAIPMGPGVKDKGCWVRNIG